MYAAALPATAPAPPAPTSSLEEIYGQHHRRVLSAAYRITGNVSDAEDVLQTVFLRLARQEDTPGPADALGPYLHRAAVNAALDLLRSRRRSRAVPLEEAGGHEEPAPGPEQRSWGREVRGRLREALAAVTPRAAEIFTLRYIEGYSNKEISHMMATSQTAIGVTLHRVRGQLRQSLGSMFGEA